VTGNPDTYRGRTRLNTAQGLPDSKRRKQKQAGLSPDLVGEGESNTLAGSEAGGGGELLLIIVAAAARRGSSCRSEPPQHSPGGSPLGRPPGYWISVPGSLGIAVSGVVEFGAWTAAWCRSGLMLCWPATASSPPCFIAIE
jgi:hypothetical protein